MFKSGIRRRLLLTFTALTTASGLLLFIIAGRQLENAEIRFYERDLQTKILTVAAALTGGEQDGGEEEGTPLTAGAFQLVLSRINVQPGSQFTVVDTRQHILVRYPDIPTQPGDLTESEINRVFNGEILQFTRPDNTGVLTVYTAVPIQHENHGIFAVIWLTAPLEPAYTEAFESWLKLAMIVLPVIIMNAAASLWLGQAIARPILQLRDAALRIAGGALKERIKVTSRDETGELATAFNTMVESLNNLLIVQRSFVSNAAHELRTPLMSLKLRIEALMDESLPANQQQSYLTEAAQEVQHMAELVTSLLTLARLDEGKHQTEIEPFDVGAALQDIAHLWRIQAQQANLTLHDELAENLPTLKMSAADFRIILDNLLNNAVKYTPAGGQIWLRAVLHEAMLQIAIQDTGEGFDKEDLAHLFERFYRSSRSRGAQVSGHGLGLAIVAALIERNNGKITAESPGVGQGAIFTIWLPIEKLSTLVDNDPNPLKTPASANFETRM